MKILRNRKLIIFSILLIGAVLLYFFKYCNQKELTFIVMGDNRPSIITEKQPDIFRCLLDEAKSLNPAFIVHLGDMIYTNSTNKDTINSYFKSFFEILDTTNAYFVPGNHDIQNDSSKFVYKKYFKKFYYSFLKNNNLFIALDVVSSDSIYQTKQITWLDSVLNASKKVDNKFIFTHYPIYTRPDIYSHTLDINSNLRNELLKRIERYKINYVFSSHLHGYNYQKIKDVYQYITGGLGAPLLPPNKGGFFHFLKITIKGKSVKVKVYKQFEAANEQLTLYKDTISKYDIYIPKGWNKTIINNSSDLSFVMFESNVNKDSLSKNSISIKCWKMLNYVSCKNQTLILSREYFKEKRVKNHGYIDIMGNKGYYCLIDGKEKYINYTVIIKKDMIYFIETDIAKNASNLIKYQLNLSEKYFKINCGDFSNTYQHKQTGYNLILPEEWRFVSINETDSTARIVINKKENANLNIEPKCIVFIDINKISKRENKSKDENSKMIVNKALFKLKQIKVDYKIINQGEFKVQNNDGYFMNLDMSDKRDFFNRRISSYNLKEYYVRYIVDSHDRNIDIDLLGKIFEK